MLSSNLSSDLNGVWLEGTALGCPVATQDDRGNPVYRFRVATSRCFRLASDTSVFTVEIPEPTGREFLGQVCRGRGIRVAGHVRRRFRRDLEGRAHEECTIVGQLLLPRVRATTG